MALKNIRSKKLYSIKTYIIYVLYSCYEEAGMNLFGCEEELYKPCMDSYNTEETMEKNLSYGEPLVIFLCGDVMTGRGIDQILPNPCEPTIYEPFMKNSEGYVELAKLKNGKFETPVSWSYIWGDAVKEFDKFSPDVKLINLETAITESDDYWSNKRINYRMHPQNINCLKAVNIDYCSLANNHVIDWGYPGLVETIDVLNKNGIKNSGAGMYLDEAETPSVIDVEGKGRVIVFSCGLKSSGIPPEWAASERRPGVNMLKDLSDSTVKHICSEIKAKKRHGDVAVVSIHWGGNWGYDISKEHIEFAHKLVDRAGVDIIYGHSSHHIKGIEVYKEKPIFYGCGDFLNDYEGISGYENYRDDLSLMYFLNVNRFSGRVIDISMVPMQIKKMKVNRAGVEDAEWIKDVLSREGKRFGTKAELKLDSTISLNWD